MSLIQHGRCLSYTVLHLATFRRMPLLVFDLVCQTEALMDMLGSELLMTNLKR